jgi:alpha-glucosidase (family GH31 glycosyl hydrolase)
MPPLNSFLFFILLWNFFQPPVSQSVWQKDSISISLHNNTLQILQAPNNRIEISSFAFNFIEPSRIMVENASADALILKLLFDKTDGYHANFPKELLLRVEAKNNRLHFSTQHASFEHITIKIKDRNEHYYGLIEKLYPDNAKNPDLRGRTVDVDVYAEGSKNYAENYASAYSAFYMSNLGYGSFFDTFAKGRYQFAVDGVTEIYHQTDALDWYLFFGSSGEKIHEQYYEVIGKPKYVPIWACGPIFWRDQNNGGSNEVLADLQNFSELKIPLTACMIDRPYSDGGHSWSKMNFSETFSQPEKWIKTINQKYGMELLTWVAPMTFTDPDFPGLLPGYKNYMDLTNPEALAEFERRLAQQQYSVGVKGHKMDRADENFPLTAQWHEPVTESATRNKYVYLYAKAIHEFLSKAYGRNQFNYARAAFHRSQPYLSAIWGGDNRSNWLGMAGSQANAMRSAFQGFPIWGNDTGGYLGEGRIDEVLYMRWLQWSAWNGMFEIKIDGAGGSGEDRPPWKYSNQLQEVFRKACEQRMQLLPYIYSCANTSYKNGVMMKPLAYAYPEDNRTVSIWDEYIFGNAFLVAPIFEQQNQREIYLPAGNWYDFRNPGRFYAGAQSIRVDVPLNEIPVFIKANSIYVTGDIFRANSRIWQGELDKNGKLEIHAYPGSANSQSGFTYVDYTDNDKEKKMVLTKEESQITFESEPLSINSTIAVRCPSVPKKVLLNNREAAFDFDAKNAIVKIQASASQSIQIKVLL